MSETDSLDLKHIVQALRDASVEVNRLEADNARLREYVQHKIDCPANGGNYCTCDLDALKEPKEAAASL